MRFLHPVLTNPPEGFDPWILSTLEMVQDEASHIAGCAVVVTVYLLIVWGCWA